MTSIDATEVRGTQNFHATAPFQEKLSTSADMNGNALRGASLTETNSQGLLKNHHIAFSAPSSPPLSHRSDLPMTEGLAPLKGAMNGLVNGNASTTSLHHAPATNGFADEYKRHSATFGLRSGFQINGSAGATNGLNLAPGSSTNGAAKSMPGSRRGSGSSVGNHDLVGSLNFGAMSIRDPADSGSALSLVDSDSQPLGSSALNGNLDDHYKSSMKQAENDRVNVRANYTRKLSVSSNALDLAPLQQAQPPRNHLLRGDEKRRTTSEWPQFADLPQARSAAADYDLSSGGRFNLGIDPPLPLTRTSSLRVAANVSAIGRTSPSPASLNDPLSAAPNSNLTSAPISGSTSSANGIPTSGVASSVAPLRTDRLIPSSVADAHQRASFDSLTFGSVQADDPLAQNNRPLLGNDTLYNTNVNGTGAGYPRYPDTFAMGDGFSSQQRSVSMGDSSLGGYYGAQRQPGGFGGFNGAQRFGTFDRMNALGGSRHKRGDMDREYNRFAGARLEDLKGDIPVLCKDQHGCRYLQKKLEEGNPEHRDIIFRETYSHLSELMIDPFGNYLCQKLLEYSTDEQRNMICEAVAADLVQISLNMHGTRAVQKMIDFLSAQRSTDSRYDAQIHIIIRALSMSVVMLIKDLNGNHVVQKCLNRLTHDDNQFIYNAVAQYCNDVATHRHGCCVLQRCIDHASDTQRIQLVTEITYNALTLVQDPYGNYVVQYILDLNDNRFSDAIIRQFVGNVCALSVQKFSSNVIEKCIRVAEHTTRKMLIEELLNRSRLEKLLRDSFGNYCVQTALDYAEPGQRMILVEGIRPILPLIRNTPYGKRIQSKLQREQAQKEQMESAAMGAHFGGYGNMGGYSNGSHRGSPYAGPLPHLYQSHGYPSNGRRVSDQFQNDMGRYPYAGSGMSLSQGSLGMSTSPAITANGFGQPRAMLPNQTMEAFGAHGVGLQRGPLNGMNGMGNSPTSMNGSPYGIPVNGSSFNGVGGPNGFGHSHMHDPYQRNGYPYA